MRESWRCNADKCRTVIGTVNVIHYGGEDNDAYTDYVDFHPNENYGGEFDNALLCDDHYEEAIAEVHYDEEEAA